MIRDLFRRRRRATTTPRREITGFQPVTGLHAYQALLNGQPRHEVLALLTLAAPGANRDFWIERVHRAYTDMNQPTRRRTPRYRCLNDNGTFRVIDMTTGRIVAACTTEGEASQALRYFNQAA